MCSSGLWHVAPRLYIEKRLKAEWNRKKRPKMDVSVYTRPLDVPISSSFLFGLELCQCYVCVCSAASCYVVLDV